MDRTDHSLDNWIAQQIPAQAIVLELCGGNGDRSLRLAQQCNATYWQITDKDHGAINQAMAKAEASGLGTAVECWAMAAERWEGVQPETSIVIVRNALHVLSPLQIRAICRQTFELRADLIIANCFDLAVTRTAEFQQNVLGTGGFVWPYSYIERIAISEGLSPGLQEDHWDDEACDFYGKITSLGFRRLG